MPNLRNWKCPEELTGYEEKICKKLKTTGKLFVFLRKQRHLIFNDEINQKLIDMYADHPSGKPPVPAAQLAMATLLQAYTQASDAEAIIEATMSKRWQMLLNCLGEEEPPFSQGTLCEFRRRMVKFDMDIVLLEHTVDIAKKIGGFGHQALRIALDSAPLQGRGRVEDTFNLIGHALELLIDCAAQIKHIERKQIIKEAGLQLIGKSSVKAALDIDWSELTEKKEAINILLKDVEGIKLWLSQQPPEITENKALQESLSLLERVLIQDIEPDPGGGSKVKQGTERNRQISITDDEMRHGHKSKSRTINGYKQHIAINMDTKLILATCVRPANEPEYLATQWLKPKIISYGEVAEYAVDRGYLASEWTTELYEAGRKVIAKPWNPSTNGKMSKKNFNVDLERKIVTCPEGHTAKIGGKAKLTAQFPPSKCNICPQKALCTSAKKGRSIQIHKQEEMMQHLQQYVQTPQGRADARERVKVEHSLASICNRKGHRARYIGIRMNEFDMNRTAMITNLHISMNLAA